MNIRTYNDTVLCKNVVKSKDTVNENGFIYDKTQLPIYKVISLNVKDNSLSLKSNDEIIVNSIGTEIYTDNEIFHIFKYENIVAKII